MSAVALTCPRCGQGLYFQVNKGTGEVQCQKCRYQWVEPEILKSRPGTPFSKPYIAHAKVSSQDQQKMEEASGFKPDTVSRRDAIEKPSHSNEEASRQKTDIASPSATVKNDIKPDQSSRNDQIFLVVILSAFSVVVLIFTIVFSVYTL
ncbi:MAG: hypothetical protein FWD72_01295 [Eggerthellaceae bacterium]|nr:hypothetical protein [Eggerthellaceae bacterium]